MSIEDCGEERRLEGGRGMKVQLLRKEEAWRGERNERIGVKMKDEVTGR